MTDLANRLRRARIDAGYTSVSEAADAHGWTYSTYAGHENGHRSPKPHDLAKYARAFGVDEAWLLRGKSGPRQVPQHDAPGLADTVEKYIAPTDRLRLDLLRLAQTIAPTAKSTDYIVAPRDYPGFAILRGDVLLIDQSDHTGKPGAVLVCQMTDTQTGAGATLLRQQTAAGPIPAFGDAPLGTDEEEVPLGTVITVLRGIPR